MGTQQSRLIWGWSVFGMIAQPACEASFSGVTWSYASTEFASRKKRPSDQLDLQKHPQHPNPEHETPSHNPHGTRKNPSTELRPRTRTGERLSLQVGRARDSAGPARSAARPRWRCRGPGPVTQMHALKAGEKLSHTLVFTNFLASCRYCSS